MKIVLPLIYIAIVILLTGCSCSGKEAVGQGDYNVTFSVNSDLKLVISWNAIDTSPVITGYDLMFGEGEDQLTQLHHIDLTGAGGDRISYIHQDLIIDGTKTYYYQVKGIQTGVATPPSAILPYKATEDLDKDGYITDDCAANVAAINPGTGELCNNRDDNCNGSIDESFTLKGSACSVGDGACRVAGTYGCSERGDTLECFDGSGMPVVAGDPVDELCDGVDNNCDGEIDNGTNLCEGYFQNGIGSCQEKKCSFSGCIDGWFNANDDLGDGCECRPTNDGVERCDGVDNDCDGEIDNLDTLCKELANGAGRCENGSCVVSGCDPDYYDINKSGSDGCEYHCTPENPGVESCDNQDNDCNGVVDDNSDVACSTICGAGVQICQNGVLQSCNAQQPEPERCDGFDNNCDGTPDNVATLCSDLPGGTGSCQNGACVVTGCDDDYYDINKSGIDGCEYHCSPENPGAETCDNEDNDCNGRVDDNSDIPCSNDCGTGWRICTNGVLAECDAPPISPETCDNKDNDCNGVVDDVVDLNCESACGSGVRSCVNGHWLGCDTAPFKEASLTFTEPRYRSGYAFTDHPGSDRLFIFGGEREGVYRNDLWYFDKTIQRWLLLHAGNAPLPRVDSALAYDHQNKILYLYGGVGEHELLGDLWRLDTTRSYPVWEQLDSDGVLPRSGHTLTYGDGVLILFGGGDQQGLVDQIATYTVDTALWSIQQLKEGEPLSRRGHIAVFINNKLILFGGESDDGLESDLWYLSAEKWEKRSDHDIISPRKNMGYYVNNQNLYIIGGAGESGSLKDLYRFQFNNSIWYLLNNDLQEIPETGFLAYMTDLTHLNFWGVSGEAGYFDLDQDQFISRETPDHLMKTASCSFPMENGFYLFGGENSQGELTDNFWFYNYSMKQWKTLSGENKPLPRSGHKMVCVPSEGAIYLFGGVAGETYLNDLWRYRIDQGEWEQVNTLVKDEQPFPGRYNHTLFYHDRYLYLFGGYPDGNASFDLWRMELRTSIWEPVSDQGTAPEIRLNPAITYVPEYNYLMMFGGESGEYLDDFWVLDPETGVWTPYWINKPFGRSYGTLHYHPEAKTILLLGGAGDNSFDDLWELHLGSSNWNYITGFNHYPDPLFHDQGEVFPYQKGDQYLLLYFGGSEALFKPLQLTFGCNTQ